MQHNITNAKKVFILQPIHLEYEEYEDALNTIYGNKIMSTILSASCRAKMNEQYVKKKPYYQLIKINTAAEVMKELNNCTAAIIFKEPTKYCDEMIRIIKKRVQEIIIIEHVEVDKE